MVKGQVKLHVEKQMHVIVDLGMLINKDYIVDFAVNIKSIVVESRMKAGKNGVPEVELMFTLDDLDLANNLKFDIENKDVLTEVIDLLKGIWLPIVDGVLRTALTPKLNEEVTKVVNETLQKEYKKEIILPSPLNLLVDLTCHDIAIANDFIIATVDGHFNNSKNPRDMDEVAALTFDMPLITD